MRKIISVILLLMIIGALMVGCKGKTETIPPVTDEINNSIEGNLPEDSNKEISTVSVENNEEANDANKTNMEPELIVPLDGETYAPLSGVIVKEEQTENRPIAVMIDNYFEARPQAGLKDAEIIYEALAEGRITRYLAIFQINQPELIGPIRSARPYYIDRALEYDPLYTHVGGSEPAKKDIIDLKMADIDGLKSGSDTFWRKNHKPIPNNMYSSYDAITKWAKKKKYKDTVDIETLSFNKQDVDLDSSDLADELKIVYKEPNNKDSTGYFIEFKYNSEDKLYGRYVNGSKHLDEIDDTHLKAKNIIVQYTVTRVIDDKGRREMDFIGEGNGYYLTNGKKTDITWKKSSRSSLTRYYDKNGTEINLNPGVTWIQVVETNGNVEIK